MAQKTERKIDLDRGVVIREEPLTRTQVYMYRDEPGTYRNVYGIEVPEVLAKRAGFDTDQLAKEKKYRYDLAAADAVLREKKDADSSNKKVVREGTNYNLMQIGKTAFTVETVDGKPMHPGALDKDTAGILFVSLEPAKPAKAKEGGKDGSQTT